MRKKRYNAKAFPRHQQFGTSPVLLLDRPDPDFPENHRSAISARRDRAFLLPEYSNLPDNTNL
jgi:hypothetical protein